MKEIDSRTDVALLVKSFYTKVRKDELIGPIFNAMIKTEDAWNTHFETLTNFWSSQLFHENSYQGNAMQTHQEVDQHVNNSIDQLHFHRWLQLWNGTIDDLFEGTYAQILKNRARNMSTYIFLKIVDGRK